MTKIEKIEQELEKIELKIEELNKMKQEAEEIQKELQKELEKAKNEELSNQDKQETTNNKDNKLEEYKKELEKKKENISKVFPSLDKFVLKVENYFDKNLEKSIDKDLEPKERIKARMNIILTEYMILSMDQSNTIMEIKDFINRNEYQALSFEYGEMIGLNDEEIINRGYLEEMGTNDFYYMFYNMLEGREIEDILDNYYKEHENFYINNAVRDENGIIQYPNKSYAYGISDFSQYEKQDLTNELLKEGYDFSWKYNFYDKLKQAGKKLHSLIDEYDKKIGYSEDSDEYDNIKNDEEYEKMWRTYNDKYSSPSHDEFRFKSKKEIENYDSIIESIHRQK